MSLSSIPSQEIAGDVAIRDGIVLMPPSPLFDELEYWHGLQGRSSEENVDPDLVRFLHGMAVQALTDGLEAARLTVIGGQTIDNPQSEIAGLAKTAIASNALGRLMRYFVETDEMAVISADASEEYTSSQEEKLILDYSEVDLDDAYGVIVTTSRLAEEPFTGGVPAFTDGQAWYTDHKGLYVSARTPAKVSPVLLDNLIIITGSRRNAEAMINAGESVRLQPYLSLAALATRQ